MKADQVEVSRDEQNKRWVIRIQVGGEVIRRYCKEPMNADQAALRDAAIKTASDEGYTVEASDVVFA
ncbi:MAG TPA: hypothetical protein VH351_19435 [Bryobacteraceae bacterium]|jgi:hypothetical protein|nr:hypothetical protein [Bryobacteraceae bacterium]